MRKHLTILAMAAVACLPHANAANDGTIMLQDWPTLEPHAIIWAAPHAEDPPKVLFLCYTLGTAEAMSIAHRLPMDYRTFEVGTSWNYANLAHPAKKEALQALLREDYDVCVMAGGLALGKFPPDIQYRLFEKMSAGMGLVHMYPSPDPLPEALRKKAKPVPREEILGGVPLALFHTLNEDPTRTTPSVDAQGFYIPAGFSGRVRCFDAGDPLKRDVPAGCSLGKSRILFLPFGTAGYVTRPNFVHAGTYTRDMYILDEYYISMVCKAILWAAHRTPNTRIMGVSPAGDTVPLGASVNATVTIRAERPDHVSLFCQVRDYQYRIHLEHNLQTDVQAGTNTVPIVLPLTDGGNYLLDVWVKQKGKVIDWGTGFFSLAGQGRITGVNINRPTDLRRGHPLEGTVSVSNAPPGASVKLSMVDSYDRIVATQVVAITGNEGRFSLPLHENLSGIMFNLRSELVAGGRTQFVANYHVSIPKEQPAYLITVAMGEDNSAFHLARIRRKRLEPYAFDGDHYISTAFQAATLAWDNRDIASQHAAVGRVTGWTIPSVADEMVERAKTMARDLKPFGQRYAVLGDDSAPAGKIAGIGDHALRYHKAYLQKKFKDIAVFNAVYGCSLASWAELNNDFTAAWVARMFRQYLRDRYGDLAALNHAWATTVADWEDIDQDFIETRKKENNIAPEVDLKRFGEANYYETYRRIKAAAQAENPDLALGHYASDIGRGLGEALEIVNFLAPYWRDFLCEEIGAFYGKLPGYYGVNGGYFDDSGTPPSRWLQPWYPLLSGLNNVIFWYTVERIPGDLTLNPLRIGIWLDEADRIKSGIGQQVVMAQMHKDPVAILHSQASGFASEYEKKIAEIGNSRLSFNAIFHDLGVQYHYISSRHLVSGVLEKERIKLLVLPYCQALSETEADAIRTFVRKGGTVLADLRPAVQTENGLGLVQGRLDDVFGISRNPGKDYVRFGRLRLLTPCSGLNVGDELADVTVDTSVQTVNGLPHGMIGESPAVIINTFGEGRAILLNFFIGQYVLLQSDNQAGALSALYDHLVRSAGIETDRIRALSGGQRAVRLRRVLFRNATMEILGVCKRATAFEEFPVAVDLALPEARHVYSMIDGRYFGRVDRFQDTFEPEQTRFYALVPYRLDRIAATVPPVVERGGELPVHLTLTTDGASPAPHVVRVRVADAEGRPQRWFDRTVVAIDGRARLMLPIAANDVPGSYILKVTDIPTGLTAEERFEIR